MNAKCVIAQSQEDIEKCYEIRQTVFVQEQGYATELDVDQFDKQATQYLVELDGQRVATARVFQHNGEFSIGRICILKEYRKLGLGRVIMSFGEQIIKKQGGKKIEISAQIHAIPFYEKCGYTAYGEITFEEEKPHKSMTKTL